MTGNDDIKARARRRVVKAMVKASIVGLIVPLSVITLCVWAAFLFEESHVFIRAFLMMLFGLAGLGLGTFITLRILEKMQSSLYIENDENSDPPRKTKLSKSRN